MSVLVLLLGHAALGAPVRCLTPEFLALRDAPLEGARMFRPNAMGFVDSAVYPIRVHYSEAGDLDRVTTVLLPMAEHAWAAQVEGMGWPAPPPDQGVGGTDAYDFYFTEDGTYGGAYTFGFGDDVTPDDNWFSNATFIAVDRRIPDQDMPAYIEHEFNHALQWTIDGRERTLFIWEATAEAITDIVYDDTDYGYELFSFQALPFMSLLHDSYTPAIYPYGYDGYFYEYGGMLFTTYLEEKFGTKDGTLLLRLWEDLAQPGTDDEPDFLDAVALVDPSVPTVASVYTDFSVWRMFAASDDDGAHYEEGADFPDYAIVFSEDALGLSEVDGYTTSPVAPPFDLGATYYRIDLEAGSEQLLHAEVLGDPGTSWGIAWAVWPLAGGPATTGSTFVADGAPLTVDIDLTGGSRAKIGVVNNGPDGMDPNLANADRRSFTLNLSLLDAPAPEDTDEPATGGGDTELPDTDVLPEQDDSAPDALQDEEEAGGCGCDNAAGLTLSPLALIGAAVSRRRRTPRARQGSPIGTSRV